MKHKILIGITLLASALTSCDMDLAPIGVLEESTALQQYSDLLSFRNGFYSNIRSFSSSQFLSLADIQADFFNGIVINGNRCGTIANGDVLPSDGDITGYWGSCYSLISSINFFLERSQPVYEKYMEEGSDKTIEIERFMAEAHFFRGYYYAMMFDRWCQVYSADKANVEGLGLPIVTEYNPTADRAKYPGRSTMAETLKFIDDELNQALQGIQDYEQVNDENLQPMAIYINSYVIKALQARIALWIGDYQKALTISQDIINNGPCQLTKRADYVKMWTNDIGSEILFEPYESTSETSNSIGSTWISTYPNQADYIPASNFIEALKAAGVDKNPLTGKVTGYKDVRYNAFLGERNLTVNAVNVTTVCFNKYPGNPNLQSGNANLMNRPKPFRLSETYMIAAESAAILGNAELANSLLNTYMKERVKDYETQTLSGNLLLTTIRLQRGYELVGEGFRLSDLRRWQQGFQRSNGAHYEYNPDVDGILTGAGINVSYTGDDHRYTWPIPTDEIQCNPQMTNQQNPGY